MSLDIVTLFAQVRSRRELNAAVRTAQQGGADLVDLESELIALHPRLENPHAADMCAQLLYEIGQRFDRARRQREHIATLKDALARHTERMQAQIRTAEQAMERSAKEPLWDGRLR